MNAGIFLVATQGNIHALSISPKGLIMGMLLAITTCFYGVLPGPLLKKYPAEFSMRMGDADRRRRAGGILKTVEN